ncbi:MAG: HEAT repeat domain-containing protein [Pseudomonadota bacterium]
MTEILPEDEAGSSPGPSSEEALRSAKDLITFFLIAMKNSALYPEDHEMSQRAVANVNTNLNEFFKRHGNFKFDVKRDQLLFGGQVIYQGAPHIGDMAFILFRDGIEWLEFREGIELSEVAEFFKLINLYREPPEESEGDMVTALWESQLPHLSYAASNILVADEVLADFSLLRPTAEGQVGIEKEEKVVEQAVSDTITESAVWELDPEEISEIREVVVENENRDSTQEMLDVLMVIIREHVEEDDLEDILKFLRTEFQDALSRVKFREALTLLEGLHEIDDSCKTHRPWAIPILDRFFTEVSGYKVLNVLNQVWPVLEILDSHRHLLRQVLLLLSPEAILALAPMSLEVSSVRIQRELMEVIGSLASRDISPIERLMNHPDENLVMKIVPVLKNLKGDRPLEILLSLVHHSSGRVRKQALDTLTARDPLLLKELFPLIEDTSDSIRMQMLKHLGQGRNELAEGLLLEYLEQRQFRHSDDQHLLACYRALGLCGSTRSIPFLQGALLSHGWIPRSKRSIHRQGAAMALVALGLDEAQDLIDKASRSLLPGVRMAIRRAKEISG